MDNAKAKGEQSGSGSTKKIRDLETFFSDAGPIKRCYAITDKGTQKCRGFGYIHYALEDDAKKAVTMFNSKTLQGNKIVVSLSKPRFGPEEEEGAEAEVIDKQAADPAAAEDATEDAKTTPKKAYKRTPKPASASTNSSAPRIPTPTDPGAIKVQKKKVAIKTLAYRALPKDCTREDIVKIAGDHVKAIQFPIDSHGGAISAYVCYKSVENAIDTLKKHQARAPEIRGTKIRVELFSDAGLKQYRLILHNLPFKCYKDEIERMFSKFGKLYDVHLPAGNKEGTIKGFGFVNFLNTADAKKAIEEGNKIKLRGRQIAVDFAVSKDKYKEFKNNPNARDESSSESSDSSDSSDSDSDSDLSENGAAKKGKAAENPADDASDAEDDADEADEVDEDSEDEDEDSEQDSDEAEDGKKQPQRSSDVHMGQTLFLRNLSFDTTERDVVDKFSEYGEVDYCKLVLDHATGMPRGSAFLKFKDKAGADLVLETVNDGHDQPQGLSNSSNKNDKKSFTSLFDNPNTLVLDGRPLIVSRAVSRTMADTIKNSEKEVKNKDKRNLFLAPEGDIKRDTPEAKFFTENELINLEKAQRDKKLKLANPNFHVSRTRLSLKNLPKDVDDKKLRSIFFDAAKKACPGEKIVIKQAKVVRDDTKLDDKGQPMSRGFGFVEFEDHTHALEALRRVNSMDHRQLGMKQHMNVQFAIENSLVLQKREQRIKMAKDNKYTPDQARDNKRKREDDAKGPKQKKQRTENAPNNNAKSEAKSPSGKGNNINNNQNKPNNKPNQPQVNKNNQNSPKPNTQNKPNAQNNQNKPNNKPQQNRGPNTKQVLPTNRKVDIDQVKNLSDVIGESSGRDLNPHKQKMFEKHQHENSRKQQKRKREDKTEDKLDQLISEREGKPLKKKKKWFL